MTDREFSWIPKGEGNRQWIAAALFVSSVVSLVPIFDSMGLGTKIPTILLLVSAIAVLGYHYWESAKFSRLPDLPEHAGAFSPFILKGEPWPRLAETAELTELIISAKGAHVVVTGASGVGKSVLVNTLVPKELGQRSRPGEITYRAIVFDRYSDFASGILARLSIGGADESEMSDLIDSLRTFLASNRRSLEKVFGSRTGQERETDVPEQRELDRIWKRIVEFLDKSLARETVQVLIFDQIERLIHYARLTAGLRSDDSLNGFEALFFLRLVRYLRLRPDCRTVFVIRSDYLFYALDILDHLPLEKSDKVRLVWPFLCPGINDDSSGDAVHYIRTVFGTLELLECFESYKRINGLDGRAFSNTFFAQLSGYMLENFYKSDEKVQEIFSPHWNEGSRTDVIRRYFEYVFNSFRRQSGSASMLEALKVVMYTIAVENRLAGQSISRERVKLLSHLTDEPVELSIDYLLKLGLIRQSEPVKSGGDKPKSMPGFRVVHDILADYAIESEQFAIDARLKDSIRGLVEGRARGDLSTPGQYFPNWLVDITSPRRVTLGAIAILLFCVHGAGLWLSQDFCDASLRVLGWVPLALDCKQVRPLYPYRLVMEAAWVSYIYVLAHGLLKNTVPHHRALWLASVSLPVIGGSLGIVFSHSPVLFLVPLCGTGMVMSCILLYAAWGGIFVGRYAYDCRVWGLRTLLNMIFTASLMLITFYFLWKDNDAIHSLNHLGEMIRQALGLPWAVGASDIALLWVILSNALMLWFLLHISPAQQSRIAVATRLALFDRTRFDESFSGKRLNPM